MKIFSSVMFLLSVKFYKPPEAAATRKDTNVTIVTTDIKDSEITSNVTKNGHARQLPESQI